MFSLRAFFRSLLALAGVVWAAGFSVSARPAASYGADVRVVGAQVALLTPFQRAKAETLIRDRLACLGCHRLDGEGGAIGPDLSDVGSRLSADGVRRILNDPLRARPGSLMPRTPMPDSWRELVATYLAERGTGGIEDLAATGALVSVAGGSGLHARTEASPLGAPLYQQRCAACHGNGGGGDGPNASLLPQPPTAHTDGELMSERTDAALFDAISGGGYIMNRSHRMPAFGETLSRGQIQSLVAYVRELCACQAPAWSNDGRSGRSGSGGEVVS